MLFVLFIKVYDVTAWMHKHPGGADVLLCAAGRDCTQVFDSYHQLATEKLLLYRAFFFVSLLLSVLNVVSSKYEIGTLVTNELPVFPERSKFNLTLRSRVERYFKDNNLDPKVNIVLIFLI